MVWELQGVPPELFNGFLGQNYFHNTETFAFFTVLIFAQLIFFTVLIRAKMMVGKTADTFGTVTTKYTSYWQSLNSLSPPTHTIKIKSFSLQNVLNKKYKLLILFNLNSWIHIFLMLHVMKWEAAMKYFCSIPKYKKCDYTRCGPNESLFFNRTAFLLEMTIGSYGKMHSHF